MLNLARLQTLCALADHGSIAATARALHLSESAVSQQLARLRVETGHELLARVGRGLSFTPAGLRLVDEACRLLADAKEVEDRLGADAVAAAGTVIVAAFATAVRTLVVEAMDVLRDSAPDLEVRVFEAEPHDAITSLRRGQVDIVITNHWDATSEPDERIETVVLLEDPLVVAVPSGHRLAGRAGVGIPQIAAERLVAWPHGTLCRRWLADALVRHGIEVDIAHVAAEHESQLALVAHGHGLAVLPRLGTETAPPGVALITIDGTDGRRIEAAVRRGTRHHPTIAAVLDSLQQQQPGCR